MTRISNRRPFTVPRKTRQRRMVALGDSLTMRGTEANNWPNYFQAYAGNFACVINAGVSGNFLADIIARLTTDVIRQAPREVIIMAGVNDNKFGPDTGDPTQMETDLTTIYSTIRAGVLGVKLTGVTIAPWGGPPGGGTWTTTRETVRQAVNTWILNTAVLDRRVSLDAIMGDFTDPARPRLIDAYVNNPPNDGLHWNSLGAVAVAQAIWRQAYSAQPIPAP